MVAQITYAQKLMIRLNTLLAEHHKKPQETTQAAETTTLISTQSLGGKNSSFALFRLNASY